MGILDLVKRRVVVGPLLLLAGRALTTSARAVDPGFPAPTGDPSIVPAGAHLDRIWDGGCVLTEGVSAGHDGMIYFSDITFSRFCKDPSGKFIQAGNIWRYNPKSNEATIYRSPSGMSNGIKFDRDGNMIAALGADYGGRGRAPTHPRSGPSAGPAGPLHGPPSQPR